MLTDTASEYARQCAHRWHTARGEALRANGSHIRFAELLRYPFGETTDSVLGP